jgi:hypothetical protein
MLFDLILILNIIKINKLSLSKLYNNKIFKLNIQLFY